MEYNFDKKINRRHTGSMKWDVSEEVLPMWVADMDFQTAKEIIEAMKQRVEHGVFGYTILQEEWYEAYQNWWEKRHHTKIEKDWLLFSTGVVPAISSIVRKMTTVGENIVVLSPVYNIFFNSILNNGRNALESKLLYNDGTYEIDFCDLEEKLKHPQTSMLIFCNPHNPIGKIWDRETLQRIGSLCNKYHVLVVSDEIHCDLTAPNKEYTPFVSVSKECRENSITCIAPTKAFNLAGLQTAALIVPNAVIRHKVNRGLNTDEVAEPNVFAALAPVVAFEKGERWLDELRKYVWDNRLYAEAWIEKELPELTVVKGEATYLLWIDCKQITTASNELCQYLKEHSGLYISSGESYGNGEGFLRLNLACPRSAVEEGLNRLKEGIRKYKKDR